VPGDKESVLFQKWPMCKGIHKLTRPESRKYPFRIMTAKATLTVNIHLYVAPYWNMSSSSSSSSSCLHFKCYGQVCRPSHLY